MFHVDSALLDFTEWVCRRFQVLTGRTNVWLAFQLVMAPIDSSATSPDDAP